MHAFYVFEFVPTGTLTSLHEGLATIFLKPMKPCMGTTLDRTQEVLQGTDPSARAYSIPMSRTYGTLGFCTNSF